MQLTRRLVVPLGVIALSSAMLAACGGGGSSAAGPKPSSTTSPSGSASTPSTSTGSAARVCPLTGAPRHKGQSIVRPALAVKIDNVSEALPQAGINSADVVVEELVEGGLTRLMAIFQCNQATTIGPIRSLRISDADILALLHGSILGYSGANPKDLPPVIKSSQATLISQDAYPQYFYRTTTHEAPHNVYSSTKRLVQAGEAKRKAMKAKPLTAPKPLFTYGTIDPAAKRAREVAMNWPAASATWTWTSASGGEWLRTQDGVADRQADGAQLSASNVVILSVKIASTGLHDVLGNPSPDDVTVGSNPAWVLRDGKMVKGTWKRTSVTAPIQLTDASGKTMALAPGRTWIELLPTPNKPTRK